MGDVRIDKFIWAVRLFKTRSLAADAIKRGRITINGAQVKSAHVVKVGDVVAVRLGPGTRSFEVLQLAQNRMGAKLVPLHLKEVTPPDQLEALELARMAASMNRRKGLGRPTKKERRDIDEFFAPEDSEFDFDDLDLNFDEEDDDEEL
ncbi:MAG: RNA-binding S4 domain-containing protein [Bacteroidales bacterium]|jgi:ribosome-associated heat shock protein Hsp15|nr:RNA-binding S4 domain-containing protein [Bacteroidales bacterium]